MNKKRVFLVSLVMFLVTVSCLDVVNVFGATKKITNEKFAAYAWILLESSLENEKSLIIREIKTAKDKKFKEKAIVLNYSFKNSTGKTQRKYAYIRLRDGEAKSGDEYISIYQLESDDFPNKHLNLNTFSNLDDVKYSAKIYDKKINIKKVKKLVTKLKKDDNFLIIN